MPSPEAPRVTHLPSDSILGHARFRRHKSLRTARMRGVLMRWVRYVLLVVAGALCAYLAYQLFFAGERRVSPMPRAPVNASDRIINPRFSGRDEASVPFLVVADNAIRLSGTLDPVVQLNAPIFDYGERRDDNLNRGRASADTGIYDAGERVLNLIEEVAFETQSGYSLETSRANVHLNDAMVVGDAYVEGSAPWGEIKAGGFQAFERERRIVFNNGVRTRLYIDRSGTAQSDPSPSEDQEP